MDKKNLSKSILMSILTCLAGAGIFSLAIILTAPKKAEKPVPAATAVAAGTADPNAIIPPSVIGTWEMTSPKLGHAFITLEKDGGFKFKSNGMNFLGKYSIEIQNKTIVLRLTGIVDGTVTLTGEMTVPDKIKWREIKGWEIGTTPTEWVKK
jgi:hypothetical protein